MRAVVAKLLVPVSCALVLWAPGVSRACAVCTSGTDDANRMAFIVTTVLLSVLPFVIVGIFIWWFRRRSRELADASETTTPGEATSRA